MTLIGLSHIGNTLAILGDQTFTAINPATGEALAPRYHAADPADVERACRLAAEAFPAFAAQPTSRRAQFLRAIATELEARTEDFVQRMPLETGLPEARVRGELARTCGQLRLFAALVEEGSWVDARIDEADPARTPQPKPDIRSMLRPLGPVVVFAASNFPLAFSVAGGDTASALAAGCPVVVKAHSAHPGVSELAGQAILAAAQASDMPEGVFSLLFGAGQDVGAALVQHPAIRAVGFTGSIPGGTALMRLAAARPEPIPVYAEMGSSNPLVVLPAALAARAEVIADGLAQSVSLGQGQFCTCPGLVLALAGPGYDRLRERLREALSAAPAGPMLTAAIAAGYRAGLARLRDDPGMESLVHRDSQAAFGAPALLETEAAVVLAKPALMHEVFGPSTLLIRCRDRTELLRLARTLDGQLTATVHAEHDELDDWRDLLAILETKAGRLLFGGYPTGVEVCSAMVHGGPFPASSDGRSTSVGTGAILRFTRPVCYQNFPDRALPRALQRANPDQLWRLVNGERIAP